MTDKNTTADDDKSICRAAIDCLEDYQERESDNIKRAEEAIKFRAGDQWPDAIKRDRESPHQNGGPRPCPVLDKTNQYVRQVVNEERQNRAAIRVRPVDDQADPKVAEIYTGIVRHIEDASNALDAYATSGEHAVDGGFGYFRILTEYCDPKSFDQDIKVKRIPNRFSVALGRHFEPDGSDATEGLIWEDVDLDEFKRLYPEAKTDGFDAGSDWASEDTIRVAEYMRIEQVSTVIHLMPDGSTWNEDELNAEGIDLSSSLKSRTTTLRTVKWYKITAQEVLERKDMLGSYIPIIKVIGNELVLPDGKIRLSGMVESAMDPQRLHNYAHAGFIEHVALAPRAPWLGYIGQFATNRQAFEMANRSNIAVLEVDAVQDPATGQMLPMPQRIAPAGIAPGWQQMLMNTEHGIEASMGMYGPTVGAKSQEKSGIALQEQKSQGYVGNFHFPDNLARSIQHAGRIIVEWIPYVYDTERVARILGEDGSEVMAYLNPNQDAAVAPRMDMMGQQIGHSYNLNVGTYDVTISTGPSYTAKRQEAAANMVQVLQGQPQLMQMIGDLVFKNMDWPGADEIAKRMKAMLPPQLQQLDDKNGQQPMDPRVTAMMGQIQQASQALEQRGQQLQQAEAALNQKAQEIGANQQEIQQEAAKLDSERQVFMAESRTKMLEIENAGLKLLQQIDQAKAGDTADAQTLLAAMDKRIDDMQVFLAKEFQPPIPQ